jgi:hypothetical protein
MKPTFKLSGSVWTFKSKDQQIAAITALVEWQSDHSDTLLRTSTNGNRQEYLKAALKYEQDTSARLVEQGGSPGS